MDEKNPGTLTIQVRTLDELFSVPPRDPWRDGPELIASGVEQAAARLRNRRVRRHAGKLVIKVTNPPAPALHAGLAALAPQAWKNHCLARAAGARAMSRSQRRAGWNSLARLAPAIIIVLALAASFDHAQPLPTLINRLFAEGFIVLGWVMLWRPIELLLFDAGQPALHRIVYEKLAALDVTVES